MIGLGLSHDVIGRAIPIAFTTAVLLGLLGVGVRKAILRKEMRKMLLRHGGSHGDAGVVLVVELVGASHCR